MDIPHRLGIHIRISCIIHTVKYVHIAQLPDEFVDIIYSICTRRHRHDAKIRVKRIKCNRCQTVRARIYNRCDLFISNRIGVEILVYTYDCIVLVHQIRRFLHQHIIPCNLHDRRR